MPYFPRLRSSASARTFLDALEPIECIICQDGYKEAHQPVTLPVCKHVFGLPCLRTWTLSSNRGHNRCPICRAVLFDDGRVPIEDVGAVAQHGQVAATLTPSQLAIRMWLREAEREVERLESLENSRPRSTHNEPHDSRTATQGNDSESAHAGTGELVVQRETEESERLAEMNRQIRQIGMLRAQLDALDHLEARMGVVSTPTSSRASTPYPSTYAQRWDRSRGRTRRDAPPVSHPLSSSQHSAAMTSSAAARTSALATARSNSSASNRNPFQPGSRPSIRPPNFHNRVPSPIQRPPVPHAKTPSSSIISGITNLNLTSTQNSSSRTVYPALADSATVTLMDFLTIPHGSRTGSPGIIPLPAGGTLGAWPYQYPAYLQPRADDPSDPGLHRLARAVVQGRIRYNADNLRVARAARLDLDVEEVRRVLGGHGCAGLEGARRRPWR